MAALNNSRENFAGAEFNNVGDALISHIIDAFTPADRPGYLFNQMFDNFFSSLIAVAKTLAMSGISAL